MGHGPPASADKLLSRRKFKSMRAPLLSTIRLILLELVQVEGQAAWIAALLSLHADYPALSTSLPPTYTKEEGAASREGGSINSLNQSPHEYSLDL